MPYDFNPKVWWLVLGMNDLTRMQCSEEIVVLGILRVVEEIMLRKPDALIVVNSLLPMIDYRSEDVKMADVVDFKTDPDNTMKKNMEIEKAVKGFVGQKGAQAKTPGSSAGTWKFVKGEKGQEKKGGRDRHLNKRKKQRAKEDAAMKGPDLKKAMERRKKVLNMRDKRMRNKKFSDNEKFRPKKPLSPFIPFLKKKALPPVWPAVHFINNKLKEFCEKHDSVTFFDATSIFAQDVGGGRHHLDNDLISPRGHPSELGFAVWEGRIMGRLDKMFKEMAPPPTPVIVPDKEDIDEEEDDDNVQEVATEPDEEKVTSGTGTEHVSEGKIAAEPDEPVKLPPRDSASADDDKAEEDIDDEDKKKEIDIKAAKKEDNSDKDEVKEIDSKAATEDKEVTKDAPKDEDDDHEEEEKKIDSKAAKEDKEVAEVATDDEDADDEEEEGKKTGSTAAKKDKKVTKTTKEEEGDDEEDVKIKLKTAKEESKKVDDGDDDDEVKEEDEERN
jgi:hypothetical protein